MIWLIIEGVVILSKTSEGFCAAHTQVSTAWISLYPELKPLTPRTSVFIARKCIKFLQPN